MVLVPPLLLGNENRLKSFPWQRLAILIEISFLKYYDFVTLLAYFCTGGIL